MVSEKTFYRPLDNLYTGGAEKLAGSKGSGSVSGSKGSGLLVASLLVERLALVMTVSCW